MLRRALWLGGIGIVLLAVAMPGYIALQPSEMTGLDDSDLAVISMPVPYADNALSYLLKAAQSSHWNDEAEALHATMRSQDGWPVDQVEALLAQNADALKQLREVLLAPHFRLPSPDTADFDTPPEIPVDTRNLVSLLEMRSRLAVRQQRFEDAFADAHDILRLAQRIEAANGAVLPTTMLSVGFRTTALDAIRHVNEQAPLDSPRARLWTSALAEYRSDSSAWKRMWSAEYQQWKKLLSWISSQSEQRGAPTPGSGEATSPAGALAGAARSQPTKTLALFAEMTRSYQRASDKSCSELDQLPDFTGTTANGQPESDPAIAIATPDYKDFFMRRCAADSALAATQVLIALKAFRDHNEQLPEHLDELVPEYLAAIPTDAFDGQPIRYSAEERLVYSRVADRSLKSDGSHLDGAAEFAEPSYPISF